MSWPYTVGEIIDRYIREMDGTPEHPGPRPLGPSKRLVLRRIERSVLGSKDAATLSSAEVIDWAQDLGLTVCPATVNQYVTYLGGTLRYAGSNPKWKSPAITDAPVKAARPFLVTHRIVGKSEPRSRRPTSDEKAALEAHFAAQNNHARTVVDMVRVSQWQHRSARRIGESCALLWRDWNYEGKTILVRKMKDPKVRNKQKVVALPWDAQELLLEWAREMNEKPELRDAEPRILPFNSKTCSQRYTLAKKKHGIDGLHLHDDRRDRSTRLVEVDGYSKEEAIAFTGHETTQVFERTYLEVDPSFIATNGPASKRESAAR